jgi:hypothetical protein
MKEEKRCKVPSQTNMRFTYYIKRAKKKSEEAKQKNQRTEKKKKCARTYPRKTHIQAILNEKDSRPHREGRTLVRNARDG